MNEFPIYNYLVLQEWQQTSIFQVSLIFTFNFQRKLIRMLNSTFDLITLAAASNSLVAFCFCNLIIAILLVGSSKPSSDIDEEKPTPLLGIAHTKKSVVDDNMNGAASKDVSILAESSYVDETVINDFEKSPDGEKPIPLPGVAHTKKCVVDDRINSRHSFNMNGAAASKDVSIESSYFDGTVINDFEESPDGDDESQNEEDDELRRRVEAFIDKVNRGWRSEKLRMYAPCRS